MTITQASSRAKARHRSTRLVLSAATIIVLVVAMTVLTGCSVQVGLDTKVNEDGSGTVGLRLAADKELQDALSDLADGLGGRVGAILGILGDLGGITGGIPQSADELFNLIIGQIPGDWTAERGTDSTGARWLTLTRSFSSPEELEEILSGQFLSAFIATDQFSLTQERGFFSTKTVFSAVADPGSVTSRAQSAADFAGQILGQVLVIDNRITLPGSIKDNNADKVEGNTLTWNVEISGAKDMYAESIIYNWGAIIGVTVAGVVVLLAIIIVLVLTLRRRRSSPPEQPAAVAPPQPPPVEADQAEPPVEADQAEPPVVADQAEPPVVAAPVPASATESLTGVQAQAIEPAPAAAVPTPAAAPATAETTPAALAAAPPPVAPSPPVAPAPPVAAPPPVASPVAAVEPDAEAAGAAAAPAAASAELPGAAAAGAAVSAETRPIVPIPLRPTKMQPAEYYTLAAAEEAETGSPADEEAAGPDDTVGDDTVGTQDVTAEDVQGTGEAAQPATGQNPPSPS